MSFDQVLDRMEDRELRRARALLFVVGVAAVVIAWLQYHDLSHARRVLEQARDLGLDTPRSDALLSQVDHYLYAPICNGIVGLVFLACGALVRRIPIVATRAALALYVASVVVDFSVWGTQLTGSVVLERGALIAALVSATVFAQLYERRMKAKAAALPAAKVV